MANTSQKIRIQNALRALALAGPFFVVSYVDGVAQDIDFKSAHAKQAEPAAAICNEVGETYIPDRQMGRQVMLKAEQWVFQLHIRFDMEVTLEAFIQGLLDNPPILERTDVFDPAYCRLASKEIAHPPQQQAANGTQAILSFIVTLGRH